MVHQFKASQMSRSGDPPCASSSPHFHWPHPQTATSSPPMAYNTPRSHKQLVHAFTMEETKQTNDKNMTAWKHEINKKIVVMPMAVEDFLERYVPSRANPPPAQVAASGPLPNVPVGQPELGMYGPLCAVLKELVKGFPNDKRLCFANNAHKPIKFPYGKYEQDHHATKPDVIASLPGKTFTGKDPGRWRNISLIFEAKSTESGDPMRYHSNANEETLVQLSKSARNILFAQSRLFTFGIGIYGAMARIYRFDHAGAVCSQEFEYSAANGAVLRDFLWRFVNPISDGCDIVGADPTVRLATSDERMTVEKQLLAGGIMHDNETSKACRWITVKGSENKKSKRYLLYELVFVNPRLFSRATTVWKALEVDENGWPTNLSRDAENRPHGVQVIIKDSWRQLARKPEPEYYKQIYGHIASQLSQPDLVKEASEEDIKGAVMKAWGKTWPGLAEYLIGDDLGANDLEVDEEERTGQQTCSGEHLARGLHRLFERSHTRMVSKSIGTPLSAFQRTKEMIQALRDAIFGTCICFWVHTVYLPYYDLRA
ncbi:uncharacterized protein C8Q71DRAFT_842494 [Rhodofomes roseus]|uniref:Fungal-type protein kinase domain-containing protein n=1 Tax=Rhodofomes roseus TaxID=34475 RepID=A0ABQ8K1Q4_9APHY|nr:uncharacterized protein C8Q71DRAFT_842494 [Rhodofomes roseus]KAH9830615.1 hypothetical protein C8Q71DRAFT_842494 [Rhodofomes roseus]